MIKANAESQRRGGRKDFFITKHTECMEDCRSASSRESYYQHMMSLPKS